MPRQRGERAILLRAIQERFRSDSGAIRICRSDSALLACGFQSDSSATTSPLYNIRCISKRGWAPFCIRRTAGECESLELYGAVHEDCDGGGRRRAVTRHTAPPGRRAVRRPPTANGTSTAPPDPAAPWKCRWQSAVCGPRAGPAAPCAASPRAFALRRHNPRGRRRKVLDSRIPLPSSECRKVPTRALRYI